MTCPDENVLAELARDELPTAERTAIEAHLHACEACSAVVAELARLFASSFTAGEAAEPEPELSASGLERTQGQDEPLDDDAWPSALPLPEGAKLGRYVVLRAVGAGAMGIVYAAYDPELDRKIALKLLRPGSEPDAGDAAALQSSRNKRLLREAQALARLAHPHAITVHDVGTWDGQVFLAMEFVEGGTLTRWLGTRVRSWQEVLGVFQQAGEGLAAAHAAGLVHRDFKPDNVLLRADGRAVVTDFGLARPAERTLDEETTLSPEASASHGASSSGSALAETLTRTGALVGTPAYMAPEQFDGKRGDVQSDQFSFCVALYEGLYGERPFHGRTLGGLMSAIHAGRIAPPLRGREVPRWLRRAVLRGLRVRPHERHPDMRALLAALRPPRLGSWRGVAAMGTLSAAVGATAMLVWAEPATNPAAYCDDVAGKLVGVWDEPARAELRAAFAATGLPFGDDAATRVIAHLDAHAEGWTQAQAEACRSEVEGREPAAVVDVRMTCLAQRRSGLEALAVALRKADADVVMRAVEVSGSLPSPSDCLDTSALGRGLASVPQAEREAVAGVRGQLAEVTTLRALGKVADARTKAEAAAASAEGLAYGPLQAEVTMELALSLQDAGELGPAEDAMHRALATGVAHDHDEVVAMAASALADLEQERMGSPAVMERWVGLGLAALLSLGGSRPHVEARLLATRGHAQRRAGDPDGAIATLQAVLALREQHWGADHYAVAEPLGALGMAYAGKGLHDESVRHIERARTVLRAAYGDQHPNYAVALQNLGTTHFLHGHYADALALYQEAHRLFHDGLGPRHPSVAVLAYNVATTLAFMERYDEALPFVRAAQGIEAEVHGARSRVTATSWSLLGEIHLRAGALAEAEAAIRESLAIYREVVPDDRRAHANVESQLGHALALAGRLPEAEAVLTAALATQRELAGEPSVEVAETSGRLAMVRLAQGRLPEATALVEVSVAQYEGQDSDPHQHAEAWFRRAQVRAAAGEPAAARADAERAATLYATLGDQPARRRVVEQWLAHP
jgi:tetratricopeptide (TPR) repeat protein